MGSPQYRQAKALTLANVYGSGMYHGVDLVSTLMGLTVYVRHTGVGRSETIGLFNQSDDPGKELTGLAIEFGDMDATPTSEYEHGSKLTNSNELMIQLFVHELTHALVALFDDSYVRAVDDQKVTDGRIRAKYPDGADGKRSPKENLAYYSERKSSAEFQSRVARVEGLRPQHERFADRTGALAVGSLSLYDWMRLNLPQGKKKNVP